MKIETLLYFWSFITIVLLILLNMVLAIVLTVHDEHFQAIKKWEEEQSKVQSEGNKDTKKDA